MASLCLVTLFVLIALAVGLGTGAWVFGANSAFGKTHSPAVELHGESQDPQGERVELVRVAEQAMMAFQRVQDVATDLAGEAGTHTSKVEAITAELQSIATGQSDVSSDAVLAAIQQIAEANSALKQRLAMAEKQVESQTSELENYATEARTDSLTGLANRRAFDDEIKKQYELWRRQSIPFTLLALDIDRFKSFNDTHGHQAGDEVLRNVGKLLAKTARQMDLPCRYGGEEFAVLLPATDIHEARVAAERFRKVVECGVVSFAGQVLHVTASIGVAEIRAEDDPAQLVRRADEALYRCKEAGRNCAYWHDGRQSLPVNTDAGPRESERVKKTIHDIIQSFERLPSKKAFHDTLQRRIAESQRFGMPLTMIQLRINDYPAIKQEYGKTYAREILDHVSQRAQLTLRQMDLLARYDDGEFLVMLPRCAKQQAINVARRLQDSIAEGYNPTGIARLPLTSDYGIAQLESKETAAAMMERAAQALAAVTAKQELLLVSAEV